MANRNVFGYQSSRRKVIQKAEEAYNLDVFGDTLAQREGYKSDLRGMDAIHFYLCQKLGRLPWEIRALNQEDIKFLLREEMIGWDLPEEANF